VQDKRKKNVSSIRKKFIDATIELTNTEAAAAVLKPGHWFQRQGCGKPEGKESSFCS
jgi:hypothetical protein